MNLPPAILNGQILPDRWSVAPVRWLSRRYSGGTPDKSISAYWSDGTIPWLNSGSVNQGVIREPSEHITEEGFASSSAKWMHKGSLVMALAGQGKTKAMVGYLDIETTGNQSLACIVPDKIEGKFLYWWLTSQYRYTRNLSSQDGRDGLNLEMIGSIRCPLPPREDQIRIATFLDEKTAHIDALIACKQDLLKRLAEKRQAVITQAVTKGLNPAAPMKDSGIDWLGQIPAHWEVKRLKHLVLDGVGLQMGPFGGMLTDLAPEPTGFKLYGQENTISGDFDLGDRWIDEDRYVDLARYQIKPGDLVITRKGSLGSCRRVPKNALPGLADSDTIAIRLDEDRLDSALAIILLHDAMYIGTQIEMNRRGAILAGLNTTVVGNLWLACPPPEEQPRIIEWCEAFTTRSDHLTGLINTSIKRAQDHRSALITAAVTGQIAGLQ